MQKPQYLFCIKHMFESNSRYLHQFCMVKRPFSTTNKKVLTPMGKKERSFYRPTNRLDHFWQLHNIDDKKESYLVDKISYNGNNSTKPSRIVAEKVDFPAIHPDLHIYSREI